MSTSLWKLASPARSGTSHSAPPRRIPSTTTAGLVKFSRVSTVIPFGSTARTISSAPGKAYIGLGEILIPLPRRQLRHCQSEHTSLPYACADQKHRQPRDAHHLGLQP